MEKSKLTFYAAKKFAVTRRTIYRWIESGIEQGIIEKKLREVGEEELIRPIDAAEFLNISIQTIYHWSSTGKIECFRLFFNSFRVSKRVLTNIKERREI
jgi:predicted site-specific integrase-resolvase